MSSLGEDIVDHWEEYLDVLVESVFINGGRSCINASSIFAPRHTREIAEAIAATSVPPKCCPPTIRLRVWQHSPFPAPARPCLT